MVNRADKTKVNSTDIARMAGVSRATVSYVINNRADQPVREETRMRVLEAIHQSGYRPHASARALVSGKTKTIGLWLQIVGRSVSGHVAQRICRQARSDDFHVVVVEIANETAASLAVSALLDFGTVDGILAVDASGVIDTLLDDVRPLPPIVSVGPAYTTNTDYVGVDLRGGSRAAMNHLIGRGCRKIAFTVHSIELSAGDPRYDAYMEGIRSIGAEPDILRMPMIGREHGYAVVMERFRAGERPDGLFCFNDDVAIGANKAISDLGLRVPDDVAIIGSDGIEDVLYSTPALSTVAQPFDEMCTTAWSYLMRRLAEPDAPIMGAVLPMELIARGSTL